MRYDLKPSPCLVALLSGVLLGACGGGNGGGSQFRADENPGLAASLSVTPENTGDGWQTSTPAMEGIDSSLLRASMELIRDGRFPGVDSIVVARHGKLIAEGYFNGFGRDTLHDLRSTGKSFTSALAGIAIQQNALALDDPISQIIPGFDGFQNMSDRKRAITVRNLLNMQSGLDCNDSDPSSPGNEEKMYPTRDWLKFILDLRMIDDPGAEPAMYCTGGVIVLGDVISRRTGMRLDDFAGAYLFGPLAIRDVEWRRSPDGAATGGGGLRLRPRDAAKFGQLYLADGAWNGARVVPAAWVRKSRERVTTMQGSGYGFLWWQHLFARGAGNVISYHTSGNGGNFIFTLPDLDLVVVFTASNYNQPSSDLPYTIMRDWILPLVP